MRFLWLLSILLAGVLVMSVMAYDAEGGESGNAESGEDANAGGGESASAEGAESADAQGAESAGAEDGDSAAAESDESASSEDGHEKEDCNKLHGVFSYWGIDFFVYGDNKLAGFSFQGEILYLGHVKDIGYHEAVTSAYGDTPNGQFYLQSGTNEQGFHGFGKESDRSPLHASGAEEALSKNPDYHGIDAAFLRGSHHAVYMAGCEYVIVDLDDSSIIGSGRNEDAHLPCHPDAAWTSPKLDWSFIAKGDKAYPIYVFDPHAEPEESLYKGFPYLKALKLCSE